MWPNDPEFWESRAVELLEESFVVMSARMRRAVRLDYIYFKMLDAGIDLQSVWMTTGRRHAMRLEKLFLRDR